MLRFQYPNMNGNQDGISHSGKRILSRAKKEKGDGYEIPVFILTKSSVVLHFIFALSLCLPLEGARGQRPPPNYSHNNMPTTNFTCDNKTTGGYYADPEAGCQMFHVCVRISEEEIKDHRFLCPNNTVFDQKNFICTNWWEIDCEKATHYYSKNDLFKVPEETTVAPDITEYENPSPDVYYEYVYEYVDSVDSQHRLNLADQNPREEKSIADDESPRNDYLKAPAHVSISQPRTTFSTSAIRRTSVVSNPSTTVITTPTSPRTTPSSTTFTSVTSSGQSGLQDVHFRKTSIGQSPLQKTEESADSFNEYDWKKSFAHRSVSSSSQTRSETEVNGSQTKNTAAPVRSRIERLRQIQNKARKSRNQQDDTKDGNARAKLEEFSNFRFYKTAFGVSYSSDDYFTTPTTTETVPVQPSPTRLTARSSRGDIDPATVRISDQESKSKRRSRGSRRFVPRRRNARNRRLEELRRAGRTASRNTRYSKYGR